MATEAVEEVPAPYEAPASGAAREPAVKVPLAGVVQQLGAGRQGLIPQTCGHKDTTHSSEASHGKADTSSHSEGG
eukprot:12932717-Prorocentrum_lima.AAC.1